MGPTRAPPGGGAVGAGSALAAAQSRGGGGVLVPAAVGLGGGGAAQGEHQREPAALVRAQTWHGAARVLPAAYGGGKHLGRRWHGVE